MIPTNVEPFDSQLFVLIGDSSITESSNLFVPSLKNDVQLVSDAGLGTQVDDACILLNRDLINQMININIDFYKQYSIVVNGNSGGQKYYPFNLWQFWEVTLYDLNLYSKIGKEKGTYEQVDPITLKCAFQSMKSMTVTSLGNLDVVLTFNCTLELVDSNNNNQVVKLYDFTFDTNTESIFYWNGQYLNAKIEQASVVNVLNLTLTSVDVLEDLTNRIEKPFISELLQNVKLFGSTGIKLDFVLHKAVSSSLVGENLQVCFR